MTRKIGSRYVVTRVLGRGTCGTVWEGTGPDGPVAVKLLREDLAADQALVARFVQERTVLTSLEHPNIVGITDLVVDGTDLALVMDLVHGSDLRHRIEQGGPLGPREAAAVAADIAEALAAAHSRGVIHRDVKPENVILDRRGGIERARLTDFGIARLVDGPRRTRATRIIGTPDYLAPEVIEGLKPGPPVDVYALGTLLFEALTGWTPFGGGHPGAVLRRHVTEPIPDLPGVPRALADLVISCLAKAPAARLTAAEIADRLHAAIPGLPEPPVAPIPNPRAEIGHDDIEPVPTYVGAVPLITDVEIDGSRSTHVNLMRPIEEVKPRPRGAHGAPASTRRRRTIAGVGIALVLAAGTATIGLAALSGGGQSAPQRPGDQPTATVHAPANGGLVTPAVSPAAFVTSLPLPAAPATPVGALRAVVAPGGPAIFLTGTDGSLWRTTADRAASAGGPREDGLRSATEAPAATESGALGGPSRGRASGGSAPGAASAATAEASSGAVRSSASSGATRRIASAASAAPAVGVVRGENAASVATAAPAFGPWQRIPGPALAAEPAVEADGAAVRLTALGTDGRVHRALLAPGAAPSWTTLAPPAWAPPLVGAPAAAGSTVLGTTGGGVLAADGSGWHTLPVPDRAEPGAALAASGAGLDAYLVRARDHAVLDLPYAAGFWRPVAPTGALSYGPPAAVTAGRVRYLVTRAASGALTVLRAAGATWHATPTGLTSDLAPGACLDGSRLLITHRTAGRLLVSYGNA